MASQGIIQALHGITRHHKAFRSFDCSPEGVGSQNFGREEYKKGQIYYVIDRESGNEK
jgi:hypothetical protein